MDALLGFLRSLWAGLTAPQAPAAPVALVPVQPHPVGVPVSTPGEFPIPVEKPEAAKPEPAAPAIAVEPAVASAVRAKFLTSEDFVRVAKETGIPLSWVVAADRVETGGLGGFAKTGRSRKLFEARWFHSFTGGRFDLSHPKLSSAVWNRALYKGGDAEEGRVEAARALDLAAANKSYSSGRFQIMGFNHAVCGWKELPQWVADMEVSEANHLDAWVGFLKSKGLDKALRDGDADAYGYGYNGAGYRENGYATKLRSIVAKLEGGQDKTLIGQKGMIRIGMNGGNVVLLQLALNRHGFDLLADGMFGVATQTALMSFQVKNGLQGDGVAGPETVKALGVNLK